MSHYKEGINKYFVFKQFAFHPLKTILIGQNPQPLVLRRTVTLRTPLLEGYFLNMHLPCKKCV